MVTKLALIISGIIFICGGFFLIGVGIYGIFINLNGIAIMALLGGIWASTVPLVIMIYNRDWLFDLYNKYGEK